MIGSEFLIPTPRGPNLQVTVSAQFSMLLVSPMTKGPGREYQGPRRGCLLYYVVRNTYALRRTVIGTPRQFFRAASPEYSNRMV
ncbi:hypothetical protein B0T18DRAFT_395733 [Schizothecium vesticola]|uniref:Uncharacterized protein n=1 Tax=Schizothecium vesticola TaxID=314040 RepID=A0AA40F854_9PEZI|nr:hypothetical protein B0T18DRAFT_395733 [Schizothecium vesticola]